jgi:chemotaxis methyl-accepting protein methylase
VHPGESEELGAHALQPKNGGEVLTPDMIESLVGIPARAFSPRHLEECFLERRPADTHRCESTKSEPDVFRSDGDSRRFHTALFNPTSRFFRNSYLFEFLSSEILSELFHRKPTIRLWSAGSAKGEEAVSLAILCKESATGSSSDAAFRIFATDINPDNVGAPGLHRFDRNALAEVKFGLVDKYFTEKDGVYFVNQSVLQAVHFHVHDLTSAALPFPRESIFGDFDLILCRNVLIYYTPQYQARIVSNLYKALAPKGYLVLGSEEVMPNISGMETAEIEPKLRLYQKRQTDDFKG